MDKEKVLLDTDIGSDIDDAVCLAYLLAQKRCDLLGITTVSGEPVQRAKMASAQCLLAGRGDIPIIPGSPDSLLTTTLQPRCPQAEMLANWEHATEFPDISAVEFMRKTILANPCEVTLLAIGPMTNVGALLSLHPEVVPMLKRIVLMCGVFDHQRRGVSIREWNAMNDPHATAMVYRAHASVHRSVGLDVTTQVQLTASEVYERFSHPLLAPVKDFAQVWHRHSPILTFHDPLAAVSIFDEEVLGYTRGQITVETSSELLRGHTHLLRGEGPHEVALEVNADRFFHSYFSAFS